MLQRSLGALVTVPRLWSVLGLMLLSSHAAALTLSIDVDPSAPGVQSTIDVLAGATVAVDVAIEDVSPAVPLDAFDLMINFDPAVLGVASVTSGGFLPGGFLPAALVVANTVSPGSVHYAESSVGGFLGGGFASGDGILVKLVFEALTNGTSAIAFDEPNILLSGLMPGSPTIPFPQPGPLSDFGLENAQVNVGAAPVDVPLPSVIALLLGGLLARTAAGSHRHMLSAEQSAT